MGTLTPSALVAGAAGAGEGRCATGAAGVDLLVGAGRCTSGVRVTGATAVAGAGAGAEAADSTSESVTRPPGPEPAMV